MILMPKTVKDAFCFLQDTTSVCILTCTAHVCSYFPYFIILLFPFSPSESKMFAVPSHKEIASVAIH